MSKKTKKTTPNKRTVRAKTKGNVTRASAKKSEVKILLTENPTTTTKWGIINGWASFRKQWDKINVEVRLGKVTLLQVETDFSKKEFSFVVLNFGIEKK